LWLPRGLHPHPHPKLLLLLLLLCRAWLPQAPSCHPTAAAPPLCCRSLPCRLLLQPLAAAVCGTCGLAAAALLLDLLLLVLLLLLLAMALCRRPCGAAVWRWSHPRQTRLLAAAAADAAALPQQPCLRASWWVRQLPPLLLLVCAVCHGAAAAAARQPAATRPRPSLPQPQLLLLVAVARARPWALRMMCGTFHAWPGPLPGAAPRQSHECPLRRRRGLRTGRCGVWRARTRECQQLPCHAAMVIEWQVDRD
jgi:hypothetical protein